LNDQLPVPVQAGSWTWRAADGMSVVGGSVPAWDSTIATDEGEHHPRPPTSAYVIW
jgi:hypothetical protein